jgi:signal transduction histidine kinase
VEGVAVVDPARSLTSGRAPSVVRGEIFVDGVARAPDDGSVIGPGRPNLEFRYSGLSLAAPEHVSFRYRLEGFDTEWVNAGARDVAYYPRMPAGRYRFVVRAANREGLWGAEAGLRLRVAGPFWNTWWFRVSTLAALLLLGIAMVRRREAGALADRAAKEEFSRRLIESQEHERRRLAGELHDGLGQELMIVRNRALLALRSHEMDAMRGQLDLIADLVAGSLGSIRELAHNLTPHQLDHLGISSALRTMIEALSETSDIEVDVRIEEIDGLLPTEGEINLYRIVQEGLNNVVRHSGAGTALIHVRREGSTVRVTLIDHGRGFLPQRDSRGRPTGGFGLSGMAERARILGGLLQVVSAPEHGTRVELVVPVVRPPMHASPEFVSRVEV